MKFAFATLKYYPFGGLEKSFLNICREALRRGHELTIYCSQWEGQPLPGAKIVQLPVRALTNHGKLQRFNALLMKHYQQENFDVLVGFKRLSGLDVYYNGDVCFAHEALNKHGSWYRFTPRYRAMAAMEEAVFSAQAKTQIMFIAEREKRIYQQHYETPEDRFFALPPGIDKQAIRGAIDDGEREAVRAEAQVDKDQLVLLMIGSDFYRKGVDRAINAVAALDTDTRKNLRLWIVGRGDSESYLRQARNLAVEQQVHFWGARDDVPRLLAAADILLHPARVETAGNAIVEGLVAGLPVVVSASAGFSSHVERARGGLLVDDQPYQQANLDKAVAKLVADQTLRQECGANGWSYADSTDLYGRPAVALDIIERAATS